MFPLSQTDRLLLILVTAGVLAFLWRRLRPQSPSLSREQLLDLKRKGALVLDVRSSGEFAAGHAKGSRNIPLPSLASRLGDLKSDQVILTCCASGARSGAARRILLKAGFSAVHNAGPWQTLREGPQ